LAVLIDQVVLRSVVLLPFGPCPPVLPEVSEADDHVPEEPLPEDLDEVAEGLLDLLVEAGVLRVDRDHEGVDVTKHLQGLHYFVQMVLVSVVRVPDPRGVDNKHSPFIHVVEPVIDEPMGLRGLRVGRGRRLKKVFLIDRISGLALA